MVSLYLERPSDLPPEVPKKKRSRVHLAVYMTKLLNFMYLALKYKRDEARKFESFESMIKNRSFVGSVLKLASEDSDIDDSVSYYQSKFLSLENRNYANIIHWLEDVWEMTLSKAGAVYSFFGLEESIEGQLRLRKAEVNRNGRPLRIRLPNFRAMLLEASVATSGLLNKSTLYIGNSVAEPSLNADLAVRLPVRSEDLEAAFNYQLKYKRHYLLNSNFEIYPFLLRARRVSYGRMERGEALNNLITLLLASRFATPKCMEDIIHGQYPLDVLLMMPLIYLNGALSFLVAFEGESHEMLTAGSTIHIQITSDVFITAFRAGTSVLDVSMRPGKKIYLAAVPITYPKLATVLATFNPESYRNLSDISSSFKSKRRHMKQFMTLDELLSR